MTTGDLVDIGARLKALQPAGWYPDSTPVLDGVIAGMAAPLAQSFTQLAFFFRQTRVATAEGMFLDLIARDYFGESGLVRRPSELDDNYRARITRMLLAPRGTRQAIQSAVEAVTGLSPLIFEPSNVNDTGAWDCPYLAFDTSGAWGATDMPRTALVTVLTPQQTSTSSVVGYDCIGGGWDVGQFVFDSGENVQNTVLDDADIYEAIDYAKPISSKPWTMILPI